ncbi:MAG: polysaccharide lyase family 7 protein [Spirochaetales bacterium]|nr:polysaccharide lyase family 7 protein [Spirochaetales bacterium]
MKEFKRLFAVTLMMAMVFAGCEMGIGGSDELSSDGDETKTVLDDVSATASSDDGNGAENTLDGDLDTRWSAEGDGEYITYDLGSSQTVTDVQIAFYKGSSRSADFEIWAGDDTSSLEQILDFTTSSGDTTELESYDVSDVTARYIRIVGYGNSSNDWNSITEVELEDNSTDDVDEGSDEEEDTDSSESSKLTADSVSASADDGNGADNTVDGDLDTRWSAEGDGEYITYDLGSSQTVTDVQIAFYKGSSRSADFEIWAGDDTSSLEQILDLTTSSGDTLELESYDVSDTSARYVRIVGYGNSSNDWNSITEVEIWGTASDDSSDDGSNDDSGDDGSSEDDTSDDDGSAEYPSDIIPGIPENWKITLPVDENGDDSSEIYLSGGSVDDRNTDAYEVVLDDLLDYEYEPYFQVDDGGVRFRAHCAGATTSGSKYPRSELRQEYNGGDNYWSVDNYQYLNTRLKVTHTPEQKPEVCITQIHGPDDEPLRIQYHADYGLYIIWNESNKDYDNALDYTLGDVLDITVTVDTLSGVDSDEDGEDDNITCEITNESTGESYYKTWTSADDEGYFKVGCYTQSTVWLNEYKGDSYEDEDIDAYGEVIVYSIDLVEDGE